MFLQLFVHDGQLIRPAYSVAFDSQLIGPATKHCWIFFHCSCTCSCGHCRCSRRRFGWRVDSRIIQSTYAGVDIGQPGTLAIHGRISNPGNSNDGVRLDHGVVVVHWLTVVALSFYQNKKLVYFTINLIFIYVRRCSHYVAETMAGI